MSRFAHEHDTKRVQRQFMASVTVTTPADLVTGVAVAASTTC